MAWHCLHVKPSHSSNARRCRSVGPSTDTTISARRIGDDCVPTRTQRWALPRRRGQAASTMRHSPPDKNVGAIRFFGGGNTDHDALAALCKSARVDLLVKYLGPAAAKPIGAATDSESERHTRATAVRKCNRDNTSPSRPRGWRNSALLDARNEPLPRVGHVRLRSSCGRCCRTRATLETRHQFRRTTPRCITREGSIKPLRSAPR